MAYDPEIWLALLMFVSPAFDACQNVRHRFGPDANASEHAQDKSHKKKDRVCAYLAKTGTACTPYYDYCGWGRACQSIAVCNMEHYKKMDCKAVDHSRLISRDSTVMLSCKATTCWLIVTVC